MTVERYTYGKPHRYVELMVESLDVSWGERTVISGDYPKDGSCAEVDAAMREIVAKSEAVRNNELCKWHENARMKGLLHACSENIHYLSHNGYRLFAVDSEVDRFIDLVYECSPHFFPPSKEEPRPLNLQIEFGWEQREMLAAAYARLIGVHPIDLFDTEWRAKFSDEYLASCLRANGVLTGNGPDFEVMRRLLLNNA